MDGGGAPHQWRTPLWTRHLSLQYADMIEEIRLVADELCFANPPHTMYYFWREFRRRRESRGLLYCTKKPFERQVLKMLNERDAIKRRGGPGRAHSLEALWYSMT